MPKMSRMPRLRAMVDEYRAEHGASESWVADKIGLDRGGLWSWWNRGLAQMPTAEVLYALAAVTRKPYRDVLDAALHDFGYLPESNVRVEIEVDPERPGTVWVTANPEPRIVEGEQIDPAITRQSSPD